MWLERDSTIVKQFAVTPGYPSKESCLFKMTMLTDNDGGIATFGFEAGTPRPLVAGRRPGAQGYRLPACSTKLCGLSRATITAISLAEFGGAAGRAGWLGWLALAVSVASGDTRRRRLMEGPSI